MAGSKPELLRHGRAEPIRGTPAVTHRLPWPRTSASIAPCQRCCIQLWPLSPLLSSGKRARDQAFRETWAEREPHAVAAFSHDFEQTLSDVSMDFPRAHVALIRTTNLLERFH